MTANEIRKDLKNIRYYYSRQTVFDKVTDTIGQNVIIEKLDI